MKIIKNNICLIAILSGVVGLSACSQDDALAPGGGTGNGNTIRFTTAIAHFTSSDAADNSGTRATINDEDGTGSFTTDDKTEIFVTYEGLPNVVSTYPAIFRNGTWEATGLTWDKFSDDAELNFHAFFPARTYTETLQDFTLPTDQSGRAQYAATDLLHASALRRVKGGGAVPLDFRHVMHRLTVNLSLSATPGTLTQADVDAATVVIKNMHTTGTIDHTGKVTTLGTLSDFTPLKSTDGGGNRFHAILFPQPVQGGTPWIEIIVGGQTVIYPVPDGLTELEGGKEQVVNLKLTNDSGSSYLTYLAGWYRNSSYDTFAYTLVNDALTVLSPPSGGSDAYPEAMAVSSGKTYVTGSYFDTDGWARACYWVDGSATKLEVPDRAIAAEPDYSKSIHVSSGSIYIAGFYYDNYRPVPCYWTDGVLTTLTLPAGASDGATASIAVSEGKIYAAGYHANNSGTITPGYWLDGSFVQLSLPAGAAFRSGEAMGIVVSDNKIYVMGTYFQDSRYYPCVWTDGTRNELVSAGSAALGSVAQSITVAGGKVYVSGYSIPENRNYRKGCYWVDGVRTDLSVPDGTWSEAASIGVIGGKVYVGGEYYTDVREKHPCYWLDGVRANLDIPMGGTSAGIKAIYLSE